MDSFIHRDPLDCKIKILVRAKNRRRRELGAHIFGSLSKEIRFRMEQFFQGLVRRLACPDVSDSAIPVVLLLRTILLLEPAFCSHLPQRHIVGARCHHHLFSTERITVDVQ